MSCITRFAPSPTGDLHLGSVRTALYCWLFAKKNNGKLILRIEDTDLARSTQKAVDIILDGLQWLGLDWDQGPLFQSQRFPRYLEVVEQLLQKNLAYRCDCTKERLDYLRDAQMRAKHKPKYDGNCREKKIPKTHPAPYVVRFKNPLTGTVDFDDLIRGKIRIANAELDDLILLRSDNTPTYNFTVVVDDLDLGITDVIRGEDHISNTPKQINLLLALGAKLPNYAHIPMILGTDGTKLSKRHGASSVLEYKKLGILPHALLNYLAKLGWSYKDQEIFSKEELIKLFDIKMVHKSAAIFNLDKLLWLNHNYIANSSIKDLIDPLQYQLKLLNITTNLEFHEGTDKIIALQQKRVKTLKEMAIESSYFYQEDLAINFDSYPETLANIKNNSSILVAIEKLWILLNNLNNWEANEISFAIKAIIAEYKLKFRDIAVPVRILTTGLDHTPSIDQILEILGKNKTLHRIANGVEIIKRSK